LSLVIDVDPVEGLGTAHWNALGVAVLAVVTLIVPRRQARKALVRSLQLEATRS
jgi:heme exporter protein D